MLCGVNLSPTSGNVKRLETGRHLLRGKAERLVIYSIDTLCSIRELLVRVNSGAQIEHTLLRFEIFEEN
jgi:hypothetical protein